VPRPLKVLIAEDKASDADLLVRRLRQAGFDPDWRRVDTEAGFLDGLQGGFELVISDSEMPQFSGARALELMRQSGLDVPFIIVSGTIGEERAVAAMQHGAADYLLKDRMARLGPAVDQALALGRLRHARAQAEGALREANTRLHHLVARCPTVLFSLHLSDSEGRLSYVSPNLHELAGYTPAESLGAQWWREHIHGGDRQTAWAGLLEAAEHGSSRVEYRLRCKDGRWIWVDDRKQAVPGTDGGAAEIVGGWTDVTARKEAEARLHLSEETSRRVVENLHGVFWMADAATGAMLYVSPGHEEIWGCTAERLYASPSSWLEPVHEADRERMRTAAQAKLRGGEFKETYRILRPDGSVRWIEEKAFPIQDGTGPARRVVGIAEDVTARKNLEAEYLRAQRLEAIGTLSSGIAHDMNNILAPMLMMTALLRDKLADPRDGAMLNLAEQSVHRGADIIKQLLAFSRATDGDWKPVHVGPLIQETARMMRESFPAAIRISEQVAGGLWPVLGDAVQLRQVLMNLCMNSREAMPEGGELLLAACNAELAAAAIPAGAEAKPGRFLRLTVADSGRGIPGEFVDRIFEPFFTTKEFGRGAGLGLSTVLGLVRGHGGFVTVESEPGRGSRFHAHLPAAADAPVRPIAPPAPAVRPGLILLADDETIVREGTRRLLENHAYRVQPAINGREALDFFLQHRDEVQLLLTDSMMPMMGGLALVRAVRALKPGLKIIAMAGPNDADRVPELAALGVTEILRKPFRPAELLAALERERAGAPGSA
jgi:PAS domain S-box-containing protein